MIFNCKYNSKNLSQDLTVFILGLVICVPLFLHQRLHESPGGDGTAYWLVLLGTGMQALFFICSLLIMIRLRYPEGAIAGVLLVSLFFLDDYFPTVPVVSYLNKLFLGPGFWALIIVGPFWVWQMLTNSRTEKSDC
jgi:hypothetical protein